MRKANWVGTLLFLGVLLAGFYWALTNTELGDVIKDSINTWAEFVKGGIEEWKQLASGNIGVEETYTVTVNNTTNNTTYTPIPNPIISFSCSRPALFYVQDSGSGTYKFTADSLSEQDIQVKLQVLPEFKVENISLYSVGDADKYFDIEFDSESMTLKITPKEDAEFPTSYAEFPIKFQVNLTKNLTEILPIMIKREFFRDVHLRVTTNLLGTYFYAKPTEWEYTVISSNPTVDVKLQGSDNNLGVYLRDVALPSSVDSAIASVTKKDSVTFSVTVKNLEAYVIVPVKINASLYYVKEITDPGSCYIQVESK